MLNLSDIKKLEPYLTDVVSMNVNILKKYGKEHKEVLLEYSNGETMVADLNSPTVVLKPFTQLRSIERSVARGKYGQNSYRGNCGYRLPQKFINFAQSKLKNVVLADCMEGSGTVRELAKEMKIPYWGNDLSKGFDFLKDELPIIPNAMWLHPPYFVGRNSRGELSKMPRYSGHQWGQEEHSSDGSHIHDWDKYIAWLNHCQARALKNLSKGGYLGLLIGSSRVEGKLYDPYASMDFYGKLESVVVKEQFNCFSDSIKYANNSFVPIIHEYLFIIRKKDSLIIPCRIRRETTVDLMHSVKTTWKELVQNIFQSRGGCIKKSELLGLLEKHPKAEYNNHLEAKIRQILNTYTDIFRKIGEGEYALC
jgi:hypothetical protein